MKEKKCKFDNLRVAFPISSYLPDIGGAQIGLHNITLRLIKKGHTPFIVAPYESYQKLGASRKQLPYKVIPFPPKTFSVIVRYPHIGVNLMEHVFGFIQKKYRINVWHGTVGYPIGVALVKYSYKSRKKIPHLIRCTGDDIQRHVDVGYGVRLNPTIDQIVTKWLPRSQKLIAITESVVTEYENLGIKREQIVRIPNGVEVKRFKKTIDKQAVRAKYNIPGDAFMLLCVGRNHPKKGFKYLIEAIPLLLEKGFDNFRIVFVGSDLDALKKIAVKKGVDKYLHFIDQFLFSCSSNGSTQIPSDKLIDLYKAADVFVFPSLIETFGIVLIEAMAAEIPIITTNVPGCRDLIKDGYNGLLAQPADPVSLAEKILEIYKNENLRSQLINNSIQYVQQFDWDIITEKYLDLYKSLVNDDLSNN